MDSWEGNSICAYIKVGVIEMDKAVKIFPVGVAETETTIFRTVDCIHQIAKGVDFATFDSDEGMGKGNVGWIWFCQGIGGHCGSYKNHAAKHKYFL